MKKLYIAAIILALICVVFFVYSLILSLHGERSWIGTISLALVSISNGLVAFNAKRKMNRQK